jgi:ketosteroid isomerase-like protein
MTPVETALRFVDSINAGDVGGIVSLMTEDHRFTDSSGFEVAGRSTMETGWAEYFLMVPDYHIKVREIFSNGGVVVIVGTAGGTYSPDGTLKAENAWERPAAWRALIAGDRVAAWQVFADNDPVRRRMPAGAP